MSKTPKPGPRAVLMFLALAMAASAVYAAGGLLPGNDAQPSYRPYWLLAEGGIRRLSVYDFIVLAAALFTALGIILSVYKTISIVRDGALLRRQISALAKGEPLPSTRKNKAGYGSRKRGAGLLFKFMVILIVLAVLTVSIISLPLGFLLIKTESTSLARGLEQRAHFLLENVAQGARNHLPSGDVFQLSLLPQQIEVMEDAVYITLTGKSRSGAALDAVWASNDPRLSLKTGQTKLEPGETQIEQDRLSADIERIADAIDAKASAELAGINYSIATLESEIRSLEKLKDENSTLRLQELHRRLADMQWRVNERLLAIATEVAGSSPFFVPDKLGPADTRYLFYKPILYRSNLDNHYYRGMVRLEVSTAKINAEIAKTRDKVIDITLFIVALTIGIGMISALVLSSFIITPIKKLVRQIEIIRDTENKEGLEGSRIDVASRDELFTLAEAINQMTDGLVLAAKANRELMVGKGIQKMFIPLDEGPGKTKLSTGHRDGGTFEIYGYYEGAKGVSGDYWDFKRINDRYSYFIKCDISGKGVSAALIMVEVATMVVNYFKEWKEKMPAVIDLTDLTIRINDFIEERGYEGKRFAAFTLGIWDSKENCALLCEAGDRKLHIWDARRRELIEELLPDSPAAGIFPSRVVQSKSPFIQVKRKLNPGDALLLYTDGIEEAKRHFRDKNFKVTHCTDAAQDRPHENHSGGQNGEEFGQDRIRELLKAVDARSVFSLVKHHNPLGAEALDFDFSACEGTLEEKILALVSVEQVFRLYPDPSATAKDIVLVDRKVDAFLGKHFTQYRMYAKDKRPNLDPKHENPGYVIYAGIREDEQYDDLTILGIRRK